jgi:Cu(I)/Ag(I) efflux system membrane protein CusA/SilA
METSPKPSPSPADDSEAPARALFLESVIEKSSRNTFLILIMTVFGIAGGIWALRNTPLDAIPDLSDGQVIISTDWEGRSPDLVEDQITYPISTRFIAAPKVKFVRGESMFGKSFVYVIFQDGTDIYWARSRVIEYLNSVRGMLPEGVNPVIGPDATGVGWVFEYALVDKTGKHSLAELRTFQDWHLRYALESVKGVAEVAPVGGFVRQYQIDLDPNKLVAYGIPLSDVVSKIRMSNADVGGKIFEVGSTEYFVRGRGYIKNIEDIENIPLKVVGGTPVYISNVGVVHLGPDIRRGVAELDGTGEVVGGVVVMRYGENALAVIDGDFHRVGSQARYLIALVTASLTRAFLNLGVPSVRIMRSAQSCALLGAVFRPLGQVAPVELGSLHKKVLWQQFSGYPLYASGPGAQAAG